MCFETKLLESYHKDKGKKDGHKNYCRKCYKTKIYSHGEKQGKEKRKPYIKKGYHYDGYKGAIKPPKPIIIKEGIKGKECATCRKWSPLTNYYKDKRVAYGLSVYCKPCELERRKKYFQTHEGKNVSHRASAKYRSRKKASNYIPYNRKKILRRDKYTCQKCGVKVHDRSSNNWNTPNKAHLDHIVSLADGGETREENLQTLCRTCNLEKKEKSEGEVQLTFF